MPKKMPNKDKKSGPKKPPGLNNDAFEREEEFKARLSDANTLSEDGASKDRPKSKGSVSSSYNTANKEGDGLPKGREVEGRRRRGGKKEAARKGQNPLDDTGDRKSKERKPKNIATSQSSGQSTGEESGKKRPARRRGRRREQKMQGSKREPSISSLSSSSSSSPTHRFAAATTPGQGPRKPVRRGSETSKSGAAGDQAPSQPMRRGSETSKSGGAGDQAPRQPMRRGSESPRPNAAGDRAPRQPSRRSPPSPSPSPSQDSYVNSGLSSFSRSPDSTPPKPGRSKSPGRDK